MRTREKSLVGYATSDWHLHYWEHHNADGIRVKASLEFIENLFKRAQISKKPIFFGGDLFHTPEGLKSPTINFVYPELIRIFNTYPDVDVYAISGNHDQYTKNYIHKPSISYTGGLASSIKNFHLLDFTGKVLEDGVGIYGIPYLYLNSNFDKALDMAETFFRDNAVTKSILLIHTTIEGSIDTNGYQLAESSVLVEELSQRFTLVLSGHIHRHQKMAKGVYHIGTSSHVKVSDEGYTPVYLEIINTKHTANLRVLTAPVEPVMMFKTYSNPDQKFDEDNIIWVFQPDKSEQEERANNTVDISDYNTLMKGYLKELGVKSPMRKNITMKILKQVQDDRTIKVKD